MDLHGGGILRLRPDGTELEVYCTGVRNILDVALDAEDEIFTYDNTDEHDWMSRLTHMVDGGFYGYPHDFVPPTPLHALDDGRLRRRGGDRGPLLHRRRPARRVPRQPVPGRLRQAQVLRVGLARDGATFRVVSKTEVFADVPADFRPVGIAWSPDGLSLYICDWQHADTKEAVAVGRLLKLTYTGESHAAPKPQWYHGRRLGPALRCRESMTLIRGLAHPARAVREVAQRRLAERGERPSSRWLTCSGIRPPPSRPGGTPSGRWTPLTGDAPVAGRLLRPRLTPTRASAGMRSASSALDGSPRRPRS